MDDFQQLVALVDCVVYGKNDFDFHPKAIGCLLYGGSILPLIAAFSLSQRNQELKFLHITPLALHHQREDKNSQLLEETPTLFLQTL